MIFELSSSGEATQRPHRAMSEEIPVYHFRTGQTKGTTKIRKILSSAYQRMPVITSIWKKSCLWGKM
jgi:hypothetical protein